MGDSPSQEQPKNLRNFPWLSSRILKLKGESVRKRIGEKIVPTRKKKKKGSWKGKQVGETVRNELATAIPTNM